MAVYSLMYDLVNENNSHDYGPLWAELKRLDAHKFQLSAWLINVNNTAKELHDHFRKLLDKNDRLLVDQFRTNESWYSGVMPGTTNWLEKNPPG